MIKKVALAAVAATMLTGTATGIAYAHDASGDNGNTTCNATEKTHQENNHNQQLAGGNASANRGQAGLIQGQIDKFPGICPSANAGND